MLLDTAVALGIGRARGIDVVKSARIDELEADMHTLYIYISLAIQHYSSTHLPIYSGRVT